MKVSPDDSIRELARKTAKSIVDHGSIPMATLKESIKLQDKVDELLAKEIEFPEQEPFPEIPEFPSEIAVTNLYTDGAALLGQKIWVKSLDSTEDTQWVYSLQNTGTALHRIMII